MDIAHICESYHAERCATDHSTHCHRLRTLSFFVFEIDGHSRWGSYWPHCTQLASCAHVRSPWRSLALRYRGAGATAYSTRPPRTLMVMPETPHVTSQARRSLHSSSRTLCCYITAVTLGLPHSPLQVTVQCTCIGVGKLCAPAPRGSKRARRISHLTRGKS